MANLEPRKIVLSDINGGRRYEPGDGVTPAAINGPIEAAAYAQSLATNAPDNSEANKVGVPSVEIEETVNGPRFKFKNLKGSNVSYDDILSLQYQNDPSTSIFVFEGLEAGTVFDLRGFASYGIKFIDWGDGRSSSTINDDTLRHTYTNAGDYTIVIACL